MEHTLANTAGIQNANDNHRYGDKEKDMLMNALEQHFQDAIASHITHLMTMAAHNRDYDPMEIYKQANRAMLIYALAMTVSLDDDTARQVLEEVAIMTDRIVQKRKKS